jgi:hypothetical protein
VDIIKEDCRSTNKKEKKKQEKEKVGGSILDEAPTKKISSQQVLLQQSINNFNKINAKCENNLQKVAEVKSERKRVNFKDHDDRKKFQAVNKRKG